MYFYPRMHSIDDVIQYARDCADNKTLSCQKHRWACERFLRDYDRAVAGYGDYAYDWKNVDLVQKWARLFKHTKGVLAGKPVDLHISIVFVVANVYGFYHRSTGYRRFTKMYFQVARKNMKSQLASILATFEAMVYLGGGMAEVYCAATKRDQAKIVYNEILRVLQRCDALRGRWKESYHTIEHLKSGSEIKALSKEDKKFGDGYNPQCAIVDEYHAHETSEVLDILESGMGARPDPLSVIITTAGFELAHPCYVVEYKLVRQVLNPDSDVQLDHYFADIHELEVNESSEKLEIDGRKIGPGELIDDPYDPANWPKANPIVCSYPEGIKGIQKAVDESKAAPEKERNLLTKRFNVWVNRSDAGYMNLQKWAACAGESPSLSGERCYVGLDLSSKLDLTSAGLVFPVAMADRIMYIIRGKSFMPECRFDEHVKTDKTSFYHLWKKDGWLDVTPGEVVDYKRVLAWVKDEIESLDAYIEEWCVDPWGATQISSDLAEEGYTVVDIVQGIKTLSEPTKEFRNMVYDRRVIHDGSPVISWAIGNAVAENVDRNENLLLSKKKSVQRIDPIASILNGFTRAMTLESTASVYSTRGLRSLV